MGMCDPSVGQREGPDPNLNGSLEYGSESRYGSGLKFRLRLSLA